MSNERIIELQPGESVLIKIADSPIESEKTYKIPEGAEIIGVNKSTLYRAEKLGKITFDKSSKPPRVTHEELMKFKNK